MKMLRVDENRELRELVIVFTDGLNQTKVKMDYQDAKLLANYLVVATKS